MAAVSGFALITTAPARSAVWNQPAGGSWNIATNWSTGTVPNAVGANATFNGAATVDNPDQSGSRIVTLDANQTVGSLVLNNSLSTFNNTISAGTITTNALSFDETGAGPATINVPSAAGTGSNVIQVP